MPEYLNWEIVVNLLFILGFFSYSVDVFLGWGGAEEMLALYREDRLLTTTPAISAKGLGWLVLLTCKFIYL